MVKDAKQWGATAVSDEAEFAILQLPDGHKINLPWLVVSLSLDHPFANAPISVTLLRA